MRRLLLVAVAAAGMLGMAVAQQGGADIAGAVAAADRAPQNVSLDKYRKPVEVLTFLGLKPGMVAADVFPGFGYYTEIMGRVVGPQGRAIGYEPKQFYDNAPDKQKALKAISARQPNVEFKTYSFDRWSAPADSLDFTMLHMLYHELYWQSTKYNVPRTDPAQFVANLYKATKPGGVVGVVDHIGPAGDTRAVVNKVHRIAPETVKADFGKAGFVFEAESPVLRNPADDHGKMVYDPAVRLRTDRFVLLFRKPAR